MKVFFENILWRFQQIIDDIHNFFMRLFYGYDWCDIWNLNYSVGKRIVKLLRKYQKTNRDMSNVLNVANLIFLYNYVLELEDTYYPTYFSDNLGKTSIDNHLYQLFNKHSADVLNYVPDKDIKKLFIFAHKVLSHWLKVGVTSFPETEGSIEEWTKTLTQLNNSLKWAIKDNKFKRGTVKKFFKYLPNMWD